MKIDIKKVLEKIKNVEQTIKILEDTKLGVSNKNYWSFTKI